eukprot:gene19164-biopygen11647
MVCILLLMEVEPEEVQAEDQGEVALDTVVHTVEDRLFTAVALMDVVVFRGMEIMEDKEITSAVEAAEEEQEVDRLTDIVEELLSIGSMPTTISVQEEAAEWEMTVATEITLLGAGVRMGALDGRLEVAEAMLLSLALEQGEVGQGVIVAVVAMELPIEVDINGDGIITRTEITAALGYRSIQSSVLASIPVWNNANYTDSVPVTNLFNDAITFFTTSPKHTFDGSGANDLLSITSTYPNTNWKNKTVINNVGQIVEYSIKSIQTKNGNDPNPTYEYSESTTKPYRIPFLARITGSVRTKSR